MLDVGAFLWIFAILEWLSVMMFVRMKIGDEHDLGKLNLQQFFHIRGRVLFCFLLFTLAAAW